MVGKKEGSLIGMGVECRKDKTHKLELELEMASTTFFVRSQFVFRMYVVAVLIILVVIIIVIVVVVIVIAVVLAAAAVGLS